MQGTHGTGKTGKKTKKIPVRGNTGNLEILSKHSENTGNLLAQIVDDLILKVKDIAIVAAKKSIFFQKLVRSAKSVLCMVYSQIM